GQKHYPIPYPIVKMAAYLGVSVLLVWWLPEAYRYWDLDFWPRQIISAATVFGFGAWIYFFEFRALRKQTN
ncbi:MAG TPA: hypothetical protein VFX48_01215, partial [Saprospiraceae bacterium]|nr:hypothetical protein [Saprospiraceae bacterium]